MIVDNKIAVVTGAAAGIGAALAQALADAGARHVVCIDLNKDAAAQIAQQISGTAYGVDVSDPESLPQVIDQIETDIGPIDLFFSNAGISIAGGPEVPDEDWQKIWDINVMSHVRAARVLVPRMIARGGGYLINTASAAGLLNQIGAAPYGVTKHAAVGFAEWLAMTHWDEGLRVSVLCPQAVRTDMIAGIEDHVAGIDGILEPKDVAKKCLQAIEKEEFLITPHDTVRGYIKAKGEDYDRWIVGMRKLNKMFGDFDL